MFFIYIIWRIFGCICISLLLLFILPVDIIRRLDSITTVQGVHMRMIFEAIYVAGGGNHC